MSKKRATTYLSGIATVDVRFALPVTESEELTTEDQVKDWAEEFVHDMLCHVAKNKALNANDTLAAQCFESVDYTDFEEDECPDCMEEPDDEDLDSES